MHIVVISSGSKFESEIKAVAKLFEAGLEAFHLRKPGFSSRRMNKYLHLFPKEHLGKVIIHTHHRLAVKYNLKGIHITEKQKRRKFFLWAKLKILLSMKPDLAITTSFHSIADMMRDEKKYHYVFLSPIFDSISKKSHRSTFTEDVLKHSLSKTHHAVFALGGVKKENLMVAREMGFEGVAVLGSIWKSTEDPVGVFTEMRNICNAKDLKIIPLNISY